MAAAKYLTWSVLLIFTLSCAQEQRSVTANVFRYNQPNHITSLDPAFAKSQNNIWAIDHLFNGLVQLDDQLRVQPCIAKSWTIDQSGKVYTFQLRKDVWFHQDSCFGSAKRRIVVAADFVYSFNRIIDTLIQSPGSWIFQDKVIADKPFTALNDSTFQIKLSRPFPPFLSILSTQYCSVVPKEALQFYGSLFRKNPVGTGAFQFSKWIENQSLFLKRNPSYFEFEGDRRLPYLDGVRIQFIADKQIAYLELLNGKLDLISGLEASYTNDLLTKDGYLKEKHTSKLQFLKNPYLNSEYFGILQTGDNAYKALTRPVRQALNYALDRQAMMRTLRNGIGNPANSGFSPAGLPSTDPSVAPGYEYNPQKASTLLAKAGYPGGKGLPEIVIHTNKDYLDICTYVSKQWENIGIRNRVEVLETATLREQMRQGEIGLFRASWIADYPDAESFLTVFYGPNPAPPNYTRYVNKDFDNLYDQAMNIANDTLRYKSYQDLDKMIIEDAPCIFLFYDQTSLTVNKMYTGFSSNALNVLKLQRVRKIEN
ncbi:MAG: ABC transporter substrate-binding protein [Saprospiraceae bacterium]